MKNFKSQICTTRKQSQKLLQLGLKESTADCHWFYHLPTETWRIEAQPYFGLGTYRPAWSLHRLIEIMFKGDIEGFVGYNIHANNVGIIYKYAISNIEALIKMGSFDKDYLEEKK